MSTTSDILYKYSSTPFSEITLEGMKEDFMKIKPINTPIYDIFLMSTIGSYINNFSKYAKWKYYENIHNEIIKMLKTEYPQLNVNYEEIIQQIQLLRKNLEGIYKVEFKTLDILDKQYKSQYKINENFIQNTVIETMSYLEFRQNINLSMKQILEKYKPDFNEIDIIAENLMESLAENFNQLELNEDFIVSINLIETVKSKISQRVETMIKEMFHSNEFNPNEFNQEEVKDIFYERLDRIYKDTIQQQFNLFSKEFLDKIEQIFDVEKEMNKLSFTCEYISKVLNRF